MTKLSDYKSKAPDIIGSTTINHGARVRLGLNCSEYVFLDHLTKKDQKGSIADTLSVYINTGFGESETKALFRSLIAKGFIVPDGQYYNITSKWEEAFPDLDREFESHFWLEVIEGHKKVAWTGAKKKAMEYYIRLRKKYSRDFIVTQRDNYFKFLDLQKKLRNFDQQRLMCQVFLNPATERYMEDYEDYIKQLKAKYGDPDVVKADPVTRDQVNQMYGKDNN